jgi:hypothetical protein
VIGEKVCKYLYCDNKEKASYSEMANEIENFLGDIDELTIISSGVSNKKVEQNLFYMILLQNLDIPVITFVDLYSEIIKQEDGLRKYNPPKHESQHYCVNNRALWVKDNYISLQKRIEERIEEDFQSIAQQSHKGLMEYIEMKGTYNEEGDLLIPKSNFQK